MADHIDNETHASAHPRDARAHRRPLHPGARAARARSSSTPRSAWAATPRRCSSGSPSSRSSGSTATPTRSASRGSAWRRFGDRARLVHTVYDGIADALDGLGIDEVDGVLFDLGVSSLQLDRAERGFSYSQGRPARHADGPDAGHHRRRRSSPSTTSRELRRIFHRTARRSSPPLRPAHRRAAGRAPLRRCPATSSRSCTTPPRWPSSAQGHPAKRVFQALRIEVNAELASLERPIPAALDASRSAVGSSSSRYQSLEDRFVKRELVGADHLERPRRPAGRAARARPHLLACSSGAPSWPTRPNAPPTPEQRPCDCARPSESGN